MQTKNGNNMIQRENEYLRVVLPNSISMEESRELEHDIIAQCGENGEKLILDFSRTSALYSSGIGLLIRLRKFLMEREGSVFLVNVSRKLRELLSQLNLDRVFPIYGTDVEFDISGEDELWKKKAATDDTKFIFIAQVENSLYRLTLSGHMSSVYDLSSLSEFNPQQGVSQYVLNLENLDIVDTYGAQLLNDFIERIRNRGARIVVYGANAVLSDILDLFPALKNCKFYSTENEAIENLQ
ncbi:STAS domain-containing protein [bacterium]|nr:STAS domain-containing protein [candidate division CSSED10-310 bacterium]